MKVSTASLLDNLAQRTTSVISDLSDLQSLPDDELNWRPATNAWTVLECIDHLLIYGDFYEAEFMKRLSDNTSQPRQDHQTTWLGTKFAKSMSPSSREKKKVKTLKSTNPIRKSIDRQSIQRLLDQQKNLLHIIDHTRSIDLQKTRVATSLSRWLTLQYGDILIVHVYHNQRHLVQIKEVLELQVNGTTS
jgi:hypothetical protein